MIKKRGDGMQKGPGENNPRGPPHTILDSKYPSTFVSIILRARNAKRDDDDSHNTPAAPATPRGGGTNSPSPAC